MCQNSMMWLNVSFKYYRISLSSSFFEHYCFRQHLQRSCRVVFHPALRVSEPHNLPIVKITIEILAAVRPEVRVLVCTFHVFPSSSHS